MAGQSTEQYHALSIVRRFVLSSKESWAHQFKVQVVLESLLEATKEGDNRFIAMMQNSNLTVSKTEFINGLATNNKKITVNFLKDAIIAKFIVLGKTVQIHFLLQPHKKMSLSCLTTEIILSLRMMIIQESDAGILGKKKSECSYQESNLRPSDY